MDFTTRPAALADAAAIHALIAGAAPVVPEGVTLRPFAVTSAAAA